MKNATGLRSSVQLSRQIDFSRRLSHPVESLERRQLLSAALAPVAAAVAGVPDGLYTVHESWKMHVTTNGFNGFPSSLNRSGSVSGTISVTNGSYNLINKTGSPSLASASADISFDGSQYNIDGPRTLYAFGSVGPKFVVITRFSFFIIAVTLPSTWGFTLFSQDDSYSTFGTGAHLSGSGEASDANGITYDASSTSSITLKGVTTPPALTPTIASTTLAPAVVGGAKSTAKVLVNLDNTGGASHGTTVVNVYASLDDVIDDSDVLVGTLNRTAPVLGSRSTLVRVPVKTIPDSLNGNYTLLAQVTDPAGNTTASPAGPSLTVAPPFVSFSEQFISSTLKPSLVSGGKTLAVVKVKVTNDGNIPSTGKSHIVLSFSPDGLAADGTEIRPIDQKLIIKPGKSATYTFPLKQLPNVEGNFNLVTQITDSLGGVSEVASPTQYELAAPFIQPTVTVDAPTPASAARGKIGSVWVNITNDGNVPAKGIVIELAPSTDGVDPVSGYVLRSISNKAVIGAGVTKRYKLTFKIPLGLDPGTYYPFVTVSIGGAQTTAVGATGMVIT